MKPDWSAIEQYRFTDPSHPMKSQPGDFFGVFRVKRGPDEIVIIASSATDNVYWEHVSARIHNYKGGRTPNWAEMCFVKEMFWDDDETVVQYHPAKKDYVNNHPHVLHLWRPKSAHLPLPPKFLV